MNHQDIIARFATAKPSSRGSDIPVGDHLFALIEYSLRPTDDYGPMLGIDLEVVQSDRLPAGTKCRDGFFVSKSDQKGGKTEVSRAMAFTNALVNAPPADAVTFAQKSAELWAPTQPGRGLLIRCICTEDPPVKKGPHAGKVFTSRQWSHIADQSSQAALRAQLDQKYPITATVAPAAAPAAPPAYGAPAGYPGYPPAPQPAPQAPPGYGYPAPPPPYAPPPGYPGAPAPQPPAAPPQYPGYPAYGQPPQAPAAAPAVPPALAGFVMPPR